MKRTLQQAKTRRRRSTIAASPPTSRVPGDRSEMLDRIDAAIVAIDACKVHHA